MGNNLKIRRGHSECADTTTGDDDSVIGFGIRKVFDRHSIFCGVPSLNTIASYVEVLIDHHYLFPAKNDDKWTKRVKCLALAWRGIRSINFKKVAVLDRSDLTEINFGASSDVICDLLEKILEPDEVFKPSGRAQNAFTPPFNLSRYPLNDGLMYWVQDRETDDIERILVTPEITKDDILELLWQALGPVIQLESNDDANCLDYVKTELTQKKIFGSSNRLIAELQEDYQYFRKNSLSRGYLLIGKPGTGKTAIVNTIVDSIKDGRVFIINGLDTASTIEEMESLFVQMKPDFIIFDDCDRSSHAPGFIKAMLKMLEQVKDKNPHTNFLFTANTFSGILFDDAVTRKGRIDQIYEVPEPNEDDRREIFQKYAADMGISFSDEDLTTCVLSSEGMTGADIKELCIQLQRATIEEVFERAQEIEILRDKYSGEELDEDVLGLMRRKLNLAFASTSRIRRK